MYKTTEHERKLRKEWKKRNPTKVKLSSWKYNLKRNYGLSLEDYEIMLTLQGNSCALCGRKKKEKRLAVDHCHKTGRVRGILCHPCNVLLGHIEACPNLLPNIKKYLGLE